MKLTQSLVAIAALSTLSFAGGDINPVTIFEQEPVVVPVEPVYVAPTPVYVAPAPIVVAPTPKVVTPPPAVVAPLVAEALGLYLAGGLTDVAVRKNGTANFFSEKQSQGRELGLTGRLGYDFMDYLGAELRGTYGVAKTGATKFKQVGAYLKPNYDINAIDGLNLYGLLGASKTNFAGAAPTTTGFSYGGGLDYGINDKISVFTDVVNYMKKSNTPSTWGLTVGAGYQF